MGNFFSSSQVLGGINCVDFAILGLLRLGIYSVFMSKRRRKSLIQKHHSFKKRRKRHGTYLVGHRSSDQALEIALRSSSQWLGPDATFLFNTSTCAILLKWPTPRCENTFQHLISLSHAHFVTHRATMMFMTALLWFGCLLELSLATPHHVGLIARASSGCGKKPFLPGVTQYRGLKSSNKDRSYSYHLPSNYDANKPYAVVLGFHGSSSIGLFFELDTKMSQDRYSSDKIMIYPNGVSGSWAGPTYHEGSTIAEDVQFTKDVIEDVKARFCVDEEKVFGAG